MKPSVTLVAAAGLVLVAGGLLYTLQRGQTGLLESPPVPSRPESQAAAPPAPIAAAKPLMLATIPDTERARWERKRDEAFPGENSLPDPDGIGPCPPADVCGRRDDSRVVRRALHRGVPTWYHENGMMTQVTVGKTDGKDALFYAVATPKPPASVDLRVEDPTGGRGERGPDPGRGK
jgi:hypothetical protein